MHVGMIGLDHMGATEDPNLEQVSEWVSNSSISPWKVQEADESVSAPVINEALPSQISSREENEVTDKLLPAKRYEFSGLTEK
jgi:6-phosphogluconate dehydrogenase (decarboxylating)